MPERDGAAGVADGEEEEGEGKADDAEEGEVGKEEDDDDDEGGVGDDEDDDEVLLRLLSRIVRANSADCMICSSGSA